MDLPLLHKIEFNLIEMNLQTNCQNLGVGIYFVGYIIENV